MRCARPPAAGRVPRPLLAARRRREGMRASGLVVACDLPRPGEVGVIVDLDPRHVTDRRDLHAAAPRGVLLVSVLVVEVGVTAPGRLERVGETLRRTGSDPGDAHVLTRNG